MLADRYARAERFMPYNRRALVTNLDVAHHWLPGEDRFWFRDEVSPAARSFVLVDAATGDRHPAFDHDRAAALLSLALDRPVDAASLPFEHFAFAGSHAITATIDLVPWTIDLAAGTVTRGAAADPQALPSPDGAWEAFVSADDLWVRAVAGGAPRRLTDDGTPDHGYAGVGGDSAEAISVVRLATPQPPQAAWSPDSRYLLTQRIDQRLVPLLHLVDVVPKDGGNRPRLHSYRFPFADDPHGATATLLILDRTTGARVDVALPPLPAEYLTPLSARQAWWSAGGRSIHVLGRDRFSRLWTLHRVDPATGAATMLIEERGETNVTVHWHRRRPILRIVGDGRILWFSERSGWGHLYLHDADGHLLGTVTAGDWNVQAITHVDENAGRVFFCGSGREPGRNPYYRHLYSVRFDGSDLRLLTPEDADHLETDVQHLLAPVEEALLPFSASGDYFVDSFSAPDLPSRLVVRSSDGAFVAAVTTADISRLQAGGFIPPLAVETLAGDGETPLHGLLYRPSDFDPARRYPLIEGVYPGPQWGRVHQPFGMAFDMIYGDPQRLAELGFVVMLLDARGSRLRSKAFWNLSYGRLEDSGMIADHVAAIRQLADRFPWIDASRVGIYGHSGGGFASTRALLDRPDVYKVAVSVAGDHEQETYGRWWADLYSGPDRSGFDRTSNLMLADRLEGQLLLIHGDMDDNCHPAHTLRLVDALIRADRDFDMLIVPGANHLDVASLHVERRRWDYFVRHLLGETPPRYRLSPPAP